MLLTLLKGKLHRATVTDANLEYMGSVAIDSALATAAGFVPNEQVDIYNVTNGERFTTYYVPAPPGSGTISIQGAAAHKAKPGDIIIIAAYAQMTEAEAQNWIPHVVLLKEGNTRA
ncbi:MAG: aspartate 1-decarboxylase [Alphaproteobacteria bacterium]